MCITKINRRAVGKEAFTLLELLIAMSILAIAMTVAYATFSTVITAWKRGTALTDNLHHGDFVIEQLAMALRSTYYPDTKGQAPAYGFVHEDNGDGTGGKSDVISWVKLGTALVGDDCIFAGSPHRTEFTVERDDEGEGVATMKAWRILGQTEDFDPEEMESTILAKRIVGFNCRAAHELIEGEIDWIDEWDHTNQLPAAIEVTLYVDAMDKGKDPVEMKRVIGVPVAPLAWR